MSAPAPAAASTAAAPPHRPPPAAPRPPRPPRPPWTSRARASTLAAALVLVLAAALGAASPPEPLKIHEESLKELLTPSEWMLLFGGPLASGPGVPDFALVRPDVRRPGDTDGRRRRRGAEEEAEDGDGVVLRAEGMGRRFHLRLRRAPAVMDPHFALLRRHGDLGEQLDAGLVEDEQRGLYRGEGSDGESAAAHLSAEIARGVIFDAASSRTRSMFILQPLPDRLVRGAPHPSHVLIRRELPDVYRLGAPTTAAPPDSSCGLSDILSREATSNLTASGTRSRVARDAAPTSGPLPAVYIETAVFVDRDLVQHMALNFPIDTEREVVRFVLAMVNAVQLLYESPSLGRPVRLALKRLELLHSEPSGLRRSHDIDRFLSSFCAWQAATNPGGDGHPLHWDHALILTGLDLYVVGKGGKVSSQVVGLAPVAGMCSASSCTVNEGRHFESVYVVAHEIGHNLGMRHDGPLSDNDCDPGSFLMSPTLGSGKTTWSACSRHYLHTFLQSPQSSCLLDDPGPELLDHSAGGVLPGERFDADQQCMLKYGRGAVHSEAQPLEDACRDLHCRRDRYTWTSHPALDGTSCGRNKWCRLGRCVPRGSGSLAAAALTLTGGAVDGGWSEWSPFSDCASGCLSEDSAHSEAQPHGEPHELRGSTGIMVSTRRCNNPRPENGGRPCHGSDRRYRTCSAPQCGNVARTTIRDFADQTCGRARGVQPSLLGTGLQMTSHDPLESCAVWCHMRQGGARPRAWSFPDGTACVLGRGGGGGTGTSAISYCVGGRCEEFRCERGGRSGPGGDSLFGLSPSRCSGADKRPAPASTSLNAASSFLQRFRDKGRRREAGAGAGAGPGTGTGQHWKHEGSVTANASAPSVPAPASTPAPDPTPAAPTPAALVSAGVLEHASGCHSTCVTPGTGLRLVRRRGAGPCRGNCTLQTCEPDVLSCGRLRTPFEVASALCAKFRTRVRRLSGLGMQISAADEDRDRPCRVACQDEAVPHRFYLVNGRDGWFPFGTDCSRGKPVRAFCVSGRCLEFGHDGTPLYEPEATLALPARDRRRRRRRRRRRDALDPPPQLDWAHPVSCAIRHHAHVPC